MPSLKLQIPLHNFGTEVKLWIPEKPCYDVCFVSWKICTFQDKFSRCFSYCFNWTNGLIKLTRKEDKVVTLLTHMLIRYFRLPWVNEVAKFHCIWYEVCFLFPIQSLIYYLLDITIEKCTSSQPNVSWSRVRLQTWNI